LPVRLNSQNNPTKVLILTDATWFGLLDLAEEYGWNPFGPILPGQWHALDPDLGGYDPSDLLYGMPDEDRLGRRLVILDDALNLADALEKALVDYEPLSVPASFYIFAPKTEDELPGLGAINETIEICRLGAFWIEEYPSANDSRG
jgi:hypothetical protein